MSKYKVGDKVRLIHSSVPANFSDKKNWADKEGLAFMGIYTVAAVHEDGRFERGCDYIKVDPRGTNNCWIGGWQFSALKISNAERVAMRMQELNKGD